ncbi:MAG: hypothetical protein HUJ99_02700, partial [Bacteroidaceae bacterium]|nr:hypothetical protein [Bacteroidaceae bacterium]
AGDAASLNQAMRNAGGVDVSLVNEKRSSVRYLCEAGVYSYSFALNTQIAKAGTKTNSYRLRLVKTVPVQKK